VAEIIDLFPAESEQRMRSELRGLLREPAGENGGGSPGGDKRRSSSRPRSKPEGEFDRMHVEVTGDRPQTFIVRGDLYINFGPERAPGEA
jgi:hypothetical protein